jgi:hypothetical protein
MRRNRKLVSNWIRSCQTAGANKLVAIFFGTPKFELYPPLHCLAAPGHDADISRSQSREAARPHAKSPASVAPYSGRSDRSAFSEITGCNRSLAVIQKVLTDSILSTENVIVRRAVIFS